MNQLLNAHRSLKQGDPKSEKDLDDATNALLDALRGLKKVNAGPKDISPEDMNEFQKALAALRKTLPAAYPQKDDQKGEAFERLLENIKGTRKAVAEKDPENGTHNLKQMWGNGKDLADKINDQAAKKPDNKKYQREKQAAKDMTDELLPRVLRKGKPAMANPNDQNAGEDLLDALRRLRRAMGPTHT